MKLKTLLLGACSVMMLAGMATAETLTIATVNNGDMVLLTSPLPTEIAKCLATDPTVEDVTLLSQQVDQKLQRLELIRPGADLLGQPLTFADRAAYAMTHIIRGGEPDFFSRSVKGWKRCREWRPPAGRQVCPCWDGAPRRM